VLVAQTGNQTDFGLLGFVTSPFNIGSGSAQVGASETFTPQETLSGAMDEFRFFHDVRTIEEQQKFARKSIYRSDDLVLYFKFNEPSGSFGDTSTNRVVLDYSGNSLHSRISENGFSIALRDTGSSGLPTNPMTFENVNLSPVLFPNYDPIIDINVDLVTSATLFDNSNPNLITRLVPSHYFLQGQSEEALETEDGTLVDAYTGESIPGSGDQGQAQLIQQLLFIYAKFLDEQKLFLDSFGSILNVTYDGIDAVPDQLLPRIAEFYGFNLPNLFTDANVDQFIDAENLTVDFSRGAQALQQIQNQIWRRILVNLLDIVRSKGTIHSIKSFIRAIGIDPDSNFRIREFGGPTRRNISNQRETRTEVAALLDMSASNSFIVSPYLSGTRTEVGFPQISGSFVSQSSFPVHGISDSPNDGLLTSGSWTYEGIYRFPSRQLSYIPEQSLVRLVVTGSDSDNFAGKTAPVVNVVATSGTNPNVYMYVAPSYGSNSGTLELVLSGANVFDGDKWSISFGRYRNDDEKIPSSSLVSSSYFLRAAKPSGERIVEQYITSSFFLEDANADFGTVVWQSLDADFNSSGTAIEIGLTEYNSGTTGNEKFLNDEGIFSNDRFLSTDFEGRVGQIRFWSQGLTLDEWREHVLNFKSVGVEDPKKSFNFETQTSGSFERIRLDISADQFVTGTNSSGEILLFDFSQNDLHASGTGFEVDTLVIKPETFYYSLISPNFDEASTTNKVRARGYLDFELSKERGAVFGVVNEIEPNEQPQDDVRFSIDFSIIDALNQDIINIFSTLDELDNALGDPELMFSPDYPDLEALRDIYFNRLTDKINLKSFFEFYKWFDRNIGSFIEALVPRKTRFRGINFVIEPHMLERSKWENLNIDQYLNAAERSSTKGTILLQQIVGEIKRY
jgi:hypothetical protein